MGRVELALPLQGGKPWKNPFLSAPPLQPQPTLGGKTNEEELALSAPAPSPTPERWCSAGYSVCLNALGQGDAELSSPCPIPFHEDPVCSRMASRGRTPSPMLSWSAWPPNTFPISQNQVTSWSLERTVTKRQQTLSAKPWSFIRNLLV